MKTKEQAFIEVMQTQSNYDFLGHREEKRTAKEIKRDLTQRLERINKTLKDKLKTTVIALFTIIAIGLTSCDKEPIEQRELITQELTLKHIYTMPMTKGFDPQTWVYEYNQNAYNITFTSVDNPAESITRSVTIAQLMQGITIDIYKGEYNITYQTIHSQTDASKLDIKINMSNTTINGTPIALQATYDDYLIVVDLPNVLNVNHYYWEGYQIQFIKNEELNIWYAYTNLNNSIFTVDIRFTDGSTKTFNLGGKVLGQIYWYTSPINAGTTITFPEWIINKITI